MAVFTPRRIDKPIQDFCRSVNPRAQAVMVEVKDYPGSLPQDCFFNVSNYTKTNGGKIVFGWAIWIWPEVFIEAEHHAVWRGENGKLLDVTKRFDREYKTCFLEDQERLYDYEKHRRLDNIRKPLRKDKDLHAFLDLMAKRAKLIEENSVGLEVHVDRLTAVQFKEVEEQALYHERKLIEKYLKPNDPCVCGSGRKFKRCCAS